MACNDVRIPGNINNKINKKMNYNELSKRVHENAVNHGFWENKLSNEHYLMLVVTEIAEMVNADRKGDYMVKSAKTDFENGLKHDGIFEDLFYRYIKDTVEDELADTAIRLFDLSGALGIDFNKMSPCRYYRAYDRFDFAENAFGLTKGLSREVVGIEKRMQFGIEYVRHWAISLEIDLEWHIEQKMRYNISRPERHGKKY